MAAARQKRLRKNILATDDPDFLIDVLEGETNLLELIAALDASIIDDETQSMVRIPASAV